MDSESPIKAWVRRHSPIKSRNKPLPPAPRSNGSPSKERSPMRPKSANISPSKPVAPHEPSFKVSKRRFSSMLKTRPQQTESSVDRMSHRHAHSVPVVPSADLLSPRTGINRLNERVSTLEAQLQAARAELATVSTSSRTRASSTSSPRRSHPQYPRRVQSLEAQAYADRDIEQRQANLLRNGKFDGVVESLLAPDYASASRTAITYSARRSMSADRTLGRTAHEQACAAYGDLEAAYLEDEEDEATRASRTRSEIRAAEWKRVQEHLAAEKKLRQGAGSKRSRSTTAADEPPSQRRKHSHGDLTDKPLPRAPIKVPSRRSQSDGMAATVVGQEQGSDTIRHTSCPRQRLAKAPAKKSQLPGTSNLSSSSQNAELDTSVVVRNDTGSTTAEEHHGSSAKNYGENVEVFDDDEFAEEREQGPPSPHRRHVPSPFRLQPVSEEFEWDEDVF